MHVFRSVRWLALLGTAVGLPVLLSIGAGSVRGQEPQPALASATASRPAGTVVSSLTPQRPDYGPISEAASVTEALTLTDSEQVMLLSVQHRNRQLDEAGFYVMLLHAAMLPRGDETLKSADLVRAQNLLDDPEYYRLRKLPKPAGPSTRPAGSVAKDKYRLNLIRTDVLVHRVTRWKANAITRTRQWGRRNVWKLDCAEADGGQPLIVFLTERPAGLAEGTHVDGIRVQVAGLFYKIVKQESGVKNESGPGGQARDYPVLTAAEVHVGSGGSSSSWSGMPVWMQTFFLLTPLLVALALIKRFTRKHRVAARQFRPLRQAALDEDEDEDEGDGDGDEEADDDYVDEELARQVSQYESDRRQDPDA